MNIIKELNHRSVIAKLLHTGKSAGEIVKAIKYAKSVFRIADNLKKS